MSDVEIIKAKIADTDAELKKTKAKLEKAETKLEKLGEAEEPDDSKIQKATIEVRELRAQWMKQTDLLTKQTDLLTEERKKENILLANQGKKILISFHSLFFTLFYLFHL